MVGIAYAHVRSSLCLDICDNVLIYKSVIGIGLEIDLDVLGYIDPGITVNIIKDGVVTERTTLTLPERVVGVIKCKNPRCITSVEREICHEFVLTDAEKKIYRCIYCDHKAK